MKIYLYLRNKVLNFTIPQKVSGSFSFDEYEDEESKLINIEAKDGIWQLYSTSDTRVIENGERVSYVPLEINKYYLLERGNNNYIIYVTASYDDSFTLYQCKKNMNIIIGNDASCNVIFKNKIIKNVALRIFIENNTVKFSVYNNTVYFNNIAVTDNKKSYTLTSGDELNVYGLKVIFLNQYILINNPMNLVKINLNTSGLQNFKLKNEKPRELEFRDTDLYDKNNYFSKSPRLRRVIKTKEIDLSPPPQQQEEKEMPMILTVGPMITMGAVSGVMLINTITKVVSGTSTLSQSWPNLVTSSAMIISMVLWPNLTKKFNKKYKAMKKKELIEKYGLYLRLKRKDIIDEYQLQEEILNENLITVENCIDILRNNKSNFWDKRIDESDFLEVRLGRGNQLLDLKVNYPEQGFSVEEDELKNQAEVLIQEFKYIKNVPIGYSFYQSKITAIMGLINKRYGLIHNIILQLITFYSYEDIKIVVITNEENKSNWDYIKYLNHSFSNDRSIRYFASDNNSAKLLLDNLKLELQNRMNKEESKDKEKIFKPHYIVITDDYSQIKSHSFTKTLTESDDSFGFSLVILEAQMSKLPSKCNNFISLGEVSSGILKNSFEEQTSTVFHDEINYSINMMSVVKMLSNIPIEFEEGNKELPDAITFLEMEKIGKVEQLNIMNRWDSNDSTTSLKAEVGVDEDGNLMYLDLHEKFHGPHGLIAGMTGSGKSEFIITYILSMAINYSPDDVSFILIDYKGGGLAFVFENKTTGISLPHLAGTITNLDKAEMDRTLVSIDSEIKRRQQKFNEARDNLGLSTIDIYKYQRLYKEGKIIEPIPHLFIVCDEFAELKAQQPEFMDNLISVARIGRSLGVHLILATQKPSGVVNDQIWSNTKFRVCLKVQDASDSREMLKRPEAASLKQTGRFYLQVGYDEYFALGQSAWCGAKYFPSEKILKKVDKSINFIDDIGSVIKNLEADSNVRLESQGEQVEAIMKIIINASNQLKKRAKRLWLPDIDPIILVDNLEQKYNFVHNQYDVKAVIGEYDAPERQEQGLLLYSINSQGNTIIYGNDDVEREKMLNTILYSICTHHTAREINIYIIDFGSEQLSIFNSFPQIGGIVFNGEDEKYNNLFNLITEEIKNRKKLLLPYGGSIDNYNSKNEVKLPRILFVLNNYEGILEKYSMLYEEIVPIARDCERYGIVMLITSNSPSTISRRITQYFNNNYVLHLTDSSYYYDVFNMKTKIRPKEVLGRGVVNNGEIHEFQTASIIGDEYAVNSYLEQVLNQIRTMDFGQAKAIPSLPDKVTFDLVSNNITNLAKVPIGMFKHNLKIAKYDFFNNKSTTILSNKLKNINSFMDSLLNVFVNIRDLNVFFVDCTKILPSANKVYNNARINYYDTNFEEVFNQFVELQDNSQYKTYNILYIIYGIEKLNSQLDSKIIQKFLDGIKKNENSSIIVCDGVKNLKNIEYESWYNFIKNNSDGIWIGKGIGEQYTYRINKVTKEMTSITENNLGFYIKEQEARIVKLLEFNNLLEEDDEDE